MKPSPANHGAAVAVATAVIAAVAAVTVVAVVAAVAETATRPQDGTVNHRATNWWPFLFMRSDPDHDPPVSDLLTAAILVINRQQPC